MNFGQEDPDYINGMGLYLSGKWKEAEKTFKELKEKYPESTYILLILGEIYYSMGRLNESLELYKKSLTLNPENNLFYYKMGVCAYRMGKLEDSLSYFRSVHENDENSHVMATYFIGLINFFLGNSKESIQSFEQMKKKSGESNISNYFLAQLKLSNNEFKESISLLEELLDITPNFAELYYLLGNAYYKLHDNFKAIQYFNKALELNPQDNRSKEMLELFSI